jgi:signal transduction histidine kinase/ligand-binding sensor domain-containing protein
VFPTKTILLIFFNILFSLSEAQQANFIKYTVYDGLVANPIRCIYQDSKGFIWIGTYDGLSRYDGYKFQNFTNTNGLSHNFINSIIEVNGKLLVGENNGAVDIVQNNTIHNEKVFSSAVNYILPYEDHLMITTDSSGIFEYQDNSFVSPLQKRNSNSLGHIVPVNDSFFLCAGVDNNLFLYKTDLSSYSTIKNPELSFYSLFRDSQKRIWACTSAGLKLLEISDNKESSFTSLPSDFNLEILKNVQVTFMIEESDRSFWIATLKGLVHLFPGGSYQVYNEKDGLPSAIVYTLYNDKENNLWIGTALGLAKWASKNNVLFYNNEKNDFKNDVSSIYSINEKNILLRTEHGLQYFNSDTREFKNIGDEKNKSYTPIVGSSPLLIHYDGNKIGSIDSIKRIIIPVKQLDTIIPGVNFACIHSDHTIFFGSFQGLFALKNQLLKRIIPYRVTSLLIDENGIIWVATWINGLYRIKISANAENAYDVQEMTPFIKEKYIRGLYSDSKKNIWVGTRYGGAFCLTEKANGNFDTQHFTRQSGLISDWVTSFSETKTGDIWVGTFLGIDKLVNEPSGFRVFNFSKAVNFFAEIKKILLSGTNNLICVANTGIAIFKDENIDQTAPLQATILSTSLGVLENKLTIFSPSEKIILKPNQNAARFEFSALGFINERQILYSYRLKGSNDSNWSKPENIHEASYASLSPGHYTFEVKTIGWNGQDGISASFPFFISTPFWKQWWFVSLCFIAVAIFFYSLYRYRIRQLLRLQNVRNSIATDLHDDIGSSLTNISILSELSNKNLSQPVKAQEFLQRISEEVQASSQAMDDIIWSVNSHNDSLQETMARMRRYAAELFDNSETSCHLNLDENTGNKKLSMEQRRDVYLIYKEGLNNIHKHANAKNIWIDVRQNQNYLFMQIKDDGKGFDPTVITHRNGLKNLSTRVEKWDGKIKIRSVENKGTNIEIKIPLKDC